MPTINIHREIGAPVEKVWSIISDLDNEAQYWHGTKSVRNISKNGNVVEREVVIAFKNAKTRQTVTLTPMTSIETEITEGPITGNRTVTLNRSVGGGKTKIEVTWDFKLAGMMSIFTGMVKKHISEGTEQALERIAKAAE